jgi:glycolate oxidase iron-sulfur subunit
MQTNFTPEQLADPQMAASEKILRKCVHCGFCTATCPTYVTSGRRAGFAARAHLPHQGHAGERSRATPEIVKHIDRCLSCLSCMTTCPSGVHYMHLVDHARAHIEQTYSRPLLDRLTRSLLAAILPYPARFRAALRLASLGRPFAGLFDAIKPLRPVAAMLRLAPSAVPARSPVSDPSTHPAAGPASRPRRDPHRLRAIGAGAGRSTRRRYRC